MAYVPLYGRITDNCGGYAHSLCLRGRVDRIGFWLNSWFGEVMNVSARLIDGKEIVAKPDLRTVRKAERKCVIAQYKEDVEKENQVILDIEIPANKCFTVRINGIPLSYERLKIMEDMKLKRMDREIEALQKTRDSNILVMTEVINE